MPQITNVRVMRFRKVQPEQFGGAGAEVELHATVLEGEDYRDISRGLLFDARAMVYENLGMKLPKSAFDSAAELSELTTARATADGTPPPADEKPASTDTTKLTGKEDVSKTSEIPGEEADTEPAKGKAKPKGRGRPKGSKNKTKKAAPASQEAATEPASNDGIPGEEPERPKDQISTNPEDRKDPADNDGIPGEEVQTDDERQEAEAAEAPAIENYDDLNDYITNAIRGGKLTGVQGKSMLEAMGVARIRDLDTQEKVAKAQGLIDGIIAQNEAG